MSHRSICYTTFLYGMIVWGSLQWKNLPRGQFKTWLLSYIVWLFNGIMSLSLVFFFKFFFALKVDVYLQSMNINVYFRCFIFVCSLSPSIINYAYPNFRTTCAMALMFIHQHEFEISTLPSIRFNGHVNSCFIMIGQHFFPVSFSSRIR